MLKNINTACAKNTGAQYARGKWLFIVEDDITLKGKDFLLRAYNLINKSAKTYSNLAAVSPKREELIRDMYFYNVPGCFTSIGRLSKSIYLDPDQEYTGEVVTTHQTSFVRRDIYAKFLSDDKNFNYYREDSEFFYRLYKNDYKILYVGDKLKVVHHTDLSKAGGSKIKSNLFKKEIVFFQMSLYVGEKTFFTSFFADNYIFYHSPD